MYLLTGDELNSCPPTVLVVDQSSSVEGENEKDAAPDGSDAVQAESEQTPSGEGLVDSFETDHCEWRAANVHHASFVI